MSDEYTPKIVAFCCKYCAYTAADLAGSMRLDYPTNIKIVQVLCTGRIDVLHILKAFEKGADAVYVAGCEPGDCHFLEGNYRAVKRMAYAKELLKEVGIEPERLEFFHIGASEGPAFAEAAKKMTDRALELGPSPLRK
ncbi:MAG: hydrogenase iron-sulfur subunit [Spirochaetes bacterium]|nr:hydrogenase iron-sulfur subunit [Spirochaetota bacterium]